MRVLIVAEHASVGFGGEAVLPVHYFRKLNERGIETRMIVHGRTEEELRDLLPEWVSLITFVRDSFLNKVLHFASRPIPDRIAYLTLGFLSRVSTQLRARRLARKIVREQKIEVVHQPIPVSPREPSYLYNLGVPVVIGPLNGGMNYPVVFTKGPSLLRIEFGLVALARLLSAVLNAAIPGKVLAAVILVANDRTRNSLPSTRASVINLVENGVDLRDWQEPVVSNQEVEKPFSFIFLGRLVSWKRVDIILLALKRVLAHESATLRVVGDGPMRSVWEAQAVSLGLSDFVDFTGWKQQAECGQLLAAANVLLLPSILEAGGAVVLEAMALGRPVIATDWGGPPDYLDPTCGILVAPTSREHLVSGFAEAMLKLARSPELCVRLGEAGRRKVSTTVFNWDRKIDRVVDIYRDAISKGQTG